MEKASYKYVTLRDVAQHAGVSHMTVSRVLRGVAGVSEVTRDKVQAAIRQTGYKPDPMLSALAAYRTPRTSGGRLLGLAYLDCERSIFNQRVREGVITEAQQYGYSVEVYSLLEDSMKGSTMSRILRSRGIRGLFFGPCDTEHHFQGWDWTPFVAVNLGALAHKPVMHSIAIDYYDGAWRGFRMLHEQGMQNIAMVIHPDLQARTGYRWLGGAYTAAAASGSKLWNYTGPFPLGASYRQWLKAHDIHAILTIHPDVLQRTVPGVRQVWFLNDWSPEAKQANCVLSTPPESIGREGVRFIHHLLLRREYGLPTQPRSVTIRGIWQSRPSSLPD
jgi:LacI family transcriptional regulator